MGSFRRNNDNVSADFESFTIRTRSHSWGELDSKNRFHQNGNILWDIKNPIVKKPFHQKQPTVCSYLAEKDSRVASTINCLRKNTRKWWSAVLELFNMSSKKLFDKIRFLKTVPGLLLLVGLSVIEANLYIHDADKFDLCIGAAAIATSVVVVYLDYFSTSASDYSSLVSYFWWSFCLSLLTFGRQQYRLWWYDDRDRLADMLLMTSTAINCCCNFLDRFSKNVIYSSVFITRAEAASLLAFLCGGSIFLEIEMSLELLIVVMASSLVLINLRMKSVMAFAYLFLFVTISGISIFDNLRIPLNPYALICYHLRLFFSPTIDFYFSPLSAIERWSCSFTMTRCTQFIMLSIAFLVQCGFGAFAFYAIFLHPEYELVFVVPVVGVSGVLWLCTHCGYFATEVVLGRKFAECRDFLHKLPTSAESTSFTHIMSSRGVRKICLVGQQTVACALLTTLLFGAICWRREDAFYPGTLLLVVGLESCSYGRTRELAVKLGGTCVAYALITPTTVANPNTSVTIVPTGSLEKQNNRAVTLINSLNRFFATYLVETLGCDYVTSGVTSSEVEKKLRSLFERRAKDASGARYDTYIFYFGGLTTEDGSLLLGDGASLSPDHVIEMWREACCHGNPQDARLLLILDVTTSQSWVKTVKSLPRDYVALQTCRMTSSGGDVESRVAQPALEPGLFTSDWVQWNCDVTRGVCTDSSDWFESGGDDVRQVIRPLFVTSRRWTDFALKVPTSDGGNLANHWVALYPTLCRPCLNLSASCASRLSLVRILGAPGARYRRLKMRWLPPKVLDTGHGFKLVRS